MLQITIVICLFPKAKAIVLLHYGNIQYHIAHHLGRTHRQAATHVFWSLRMRLVSCRGQNPLPYEVESLKGADNSAPPSFPHKKRESFR